MGLWGPSKKPDGTTPVVCRTCQGDGVRNGQECNACHGDGCT